MLGPLLLIRSPGGEHSPVHRQWPASCGHDRPASRRRSDQRRTFLRFAHFNPGRLPGPAARCQQCIKAADILMREEDHARGGGEALARGGPVQWRWTGVLRALCSRSIGSEVE
jgi:hypothetical protein